MVGKEVIRMRIIVDELPVRASDCPFFHQCDCSLGDRSMCRQYERERYPNLNGLEDCPFLKPLEGGD
jgi:hypothetical protein